jgi:hypothetical protein
VHDAVTEALKEWFDKRGLEVPVRAKEMTKQRSVKVVS